MVQPTPNEHSRSASTAIRCLLGLTQATGVLYGGRLGEYHGYKSTESLCLHVNKTE